MPEHPTDDTHQVRLRMVRLGIRPQAVGYGIVTESIADFLASLAALRVKSRKRDATHNGTKCGYGAEKQFGFFHMCAGVPSVGRSGFGKMRDVPA